MADVATLDWPTTMFHDPDGSMDETTTISSLAGAEGAEVSISGWLYGKRSGGKIVFLLVRDGTGVCQCIAEAGVPEVFEAASDLTLESSIQISGNVRADERAAGGYEIAATSLKVLQKSDEYPISRKSHGVDFLMSHRHLWLRSARQTAILRIRHTLIRSCRQFFDDRGFTLIDTPIMTRGAGEDAETLFPVDYFDEKAYLAQTGQLYLESACMALRKVYSFGPTFRAEKSKTRRHLTEFWMVEPEMAFAELDDVVVLAEDMVCHLVESVLAAHEDDLLAIGRDVEPLRKVCKPFVRLTYSEAVEVLRSDDTRKWLESELAKDRQTLQTWVNELSNMEAQLASAKKEWKRDKIKKAMTELRDNMHELERDLATRPEHIEMAQSFEWGKDLGGSDETILSRRYDRPVVVTDYPREAKAFYMKVSATDDRTVRNADVLAPEGYGEIIGGSQREEDPDVLLARIEEAGLNPDDYSWYMDLRRYGSVPHGGFGLGIERALSWICGLRHVRESIPFPRLMGKIGI